MAELLQSLSAYLDAPTNYVGTFIFQSYIVAALILTAFLSISLIQDYSNLSAAQRKDKNVKLAICLIFAAASFAVLSYNMLTVLIVSYRTWKPMLSRQDLLESLWTWMFESSLFDRFARDLLVDRDAQLWAAIALTRAGAESLVMGRLGKMHDVPHLWMYFVLAQILPPSFAFFLFNLAVIMRESKTEDANSDTQSDPTSQTASTEVDEKPETGVTQPEKVNGAPVADQSPKIASSTAKLENALQSPPSTDALKLFVVGAAVITWIGTETFAEGNITMDILFIRVVLLLPLFIPAIAIPEFGVSELLGLDTAVLSGAYGYKMYLEENPIDFFWSHDANAALRSLTQDWMMGRVGMWVLGRWK